MTRLRSIYALSLLCLASNFQLDHAQALLVEQGMLMRNCTHVTSDVRTDVTAYVDWEFTLNCTDLASLWTKYFKNKVIVENSQCYIKPTNGHFQADSVAIRLSANAPVRSTYAVLLAYDSLCLTKNVTVHLKKLPVESCRDDVISHITQDVNVHHLQVYMHSILHLKCVPAPNAGEDSILPPAVHHSEYKAQWYYLERNKEGNVTGACYKLEQKANRYQLHSVEGHPNDIRRTNINLFHPGIYSCGITYRNRTVFITHYSVCIKKNDPINSPSVICPEERKFYVGETVKIECHADTPKGKILPSELEITWKKGNSPGTPALCTNANLTGTSTSPDSRLSCSLRDFVNEGHRCYKYVPTEKLLNAVAKHTQMKVDLTLRNLRKSDQGIYSVQVRYKNLPSESKTISLKFNPRFELEKIVTGLCSALVVMLVILLFVFFLWYNWIQVQLFVRRHNGKYDKDDKKYVVIFAYLHSSEMPEEAKKNTKRIVSSVKDRLRSMNYQYYDSAEEYDPGFEVATLLKYLDQSHRMIIVLTEEFVNETWGRFVAQQGFYNMIKNKTKLIFIRAPNAGKALRKLSDKHDNFTKELREAMKACRSIKWKPSMSESRFQDSVQYALPKLRRSGESSIEHHRTPKYERMNTTLSTQTMLSELPPTPSTPDEGFNHFPVFSSIEA